MKSDYFIQQYKTIEPALKEFTVYTPEAHM